MKQKFTLQNLSKVMFVLFCAVFFTNSAHAQSGSFITWSHQVGCIEYDSEGNTDDPKRLVLLEDIQDGPCVRVCEFNSVTYTVWGDDVASVAWSSTGGNITSVYGTGNKNAVIQWDNAGSGSIGLTITYNDNTVQNLTLCIEKITAPRAEFGIYGVSEEPVFCLDTDIYFENLSITNGGTDLNGYFWDFGDGNYSGEFEPVHSYNQPGNYTIRLVVYNTCSCSSTYDIDIKIVDKPFVEIYCPSVVCEGDTVNYTTSANCPGSWEVTGGSIVANNGISIDVRWDNAAPDGFGSVSYRSECACPFWTTIKVPVVLRRGFITGPAELCVGEQGIFSLPQWPTTHFQWNLVSLTNPGSATNLVYTEQRNEIVVDALEPGDYVLECLFTNTLVGCKGSASFSFTISQGTTIMGEEIVCSGTQHSYTNSDNASVNWTLTSNDITIATATGVTFQHNFAAPGSYTLSLVNGASNCEGVPFTIDVYETPEAPSGTLDGDMFICPGSPYEYTLLNNDPATIYEWDVLNGTIQGSTTGETVTVEFGPSGPYEISIIQKSISFPGCESEPAVYTINQIQPNATIVNNDGLTVFCPSSETTFTASFANYTPDFIEWSVLDNFGNVISGINDDTVTVSWNEISNSNTGTLRLKVKVCGQDHFFDTPIELYELPTLSLDVSDEICFGTQIQANLTITSPDPVTSGNILWNFGNGTQLQTAISPTGQYMLANPYQNTTGGNIGFTITATLISPNGCSYQPSSGDEIIVFPQTTINISPGYSYLICPATYDGSIVLNANAVSGLNLTLSYQWYRNGAALPNATASSYQIPTALPLGIYYVRVTDDNNCMVQSQSISVTESCGPVETCSIPANADINLSAGWSSCNTINASLSFNGTASVTWVGSPLIDLVSGNNNGAQFTSDIPGTHTVTAIITFQTPQGPCTTQRSIDVITNYDPEFNYEISCNGTSTGYEVTLFNNSTIFDIGPSNPITYTFSGPAMTTQTGEEVTVNNLSPGTYNFTLVLSSPGRPNCSITKSIVLDPLPTASFLPLEDSYCAESPIILTITNYNPDNTYEWFFNGTSYIASGPVTEIQIPTPFTGIQVSLEERTPYGCEVSNNSQGFDIIKALYLGSSLTTANSPSCQGDSPGPSITYNYGIGSPPDSFTWMKGNQVISTTNSNVFYPTSTGTYWAIAYDSNGCMDAEVTSVGIIIQRPPQVHVSGSSIICNDGEETMHGSAPLTGMEYRWLVNGNQAPGIYGIWSTTTPLDFPVDTSVAGTFTYTLEVRPVNSPACGGSAARTVTIYPPVTEPVLNYQVLTCEPYYVEVTASGGSGTYNWTNGSTGTTAYTSVGGAIGVTYIDANGCQATKVITIPHSVDSSLWMIPAGCYSLCLTTSPAAYVLGPLATYSHYDWLLNNQAVLSGSNSMVPNIEITQAGTYQLVVENDGCVAESNTFSVSPNLEGCEYDDCKLRVSIKDTKYQNGVYFVNGSITNPNPFSITLNLSSFNGYGTYSPSVITIGPSGTYYFNPLQFIPNPGYSGGPDIMVIQGEDCLQVVEIEFANSGANRLAMPSGEEMKMIVAPNPASHYTTVDFSLGSDYTTAETMTVYSLLGIAVAEIKLDALSGQLTIDTENLPSGSYIISIRADGKNALQKVLIVK